MPFVMAQCVDLGPVVTDGLLAGVGDGAEHSAAIVIDGNVDELSGPTRARRSALIAGHILTWDLERILGVYANTLTQKVRAVYSANYSRQRDSKQSTSSSRTFCLANNRITLRRLLPFGSPA